MDVGNPWPNECKCCMLIIGQPPLAPPCGSTFDIYWVCLIVTSLICRILMLVCTALVLMTHWKDWALQELCCPWQVSYSLSWPLVDWGKALCSVLCVVLSITWSIECLAVSSENSAEKMQANSTSSCVLLSSACCCSSWLGLTAQKTNTCALPCPFLFSTSPLPQSAGWEQKLYSCSKSLSLCLVRPLTDK